LGWVNYKRVEVLLVVLRPLLVHLLLLLNPVETRLFKRGRRRVLVGVRLTPGARVRLMREQRAKERRRVHRPQREEVRSQKAVMRSQKEEVRRRSQKATSVVSPPGLKPLEGPRPLGRVPLLVQGLELGNQELQPLHSVVWVLLFLLLLKLWMGLE
jgi:hypothetical protein